MPEIYLDVDVALSEVPVNIFPLTDDTDFKTRETAVVYNAAGMDLVWNFVTSAGAMTQTAVTPTTEGTHDWTHQGDGMYTIEIPASGGASINNDTEGYGWFTGYATGVLPWRGPIIGFRHAAINDSLCDTNTSGLATDTELAKVPKSDSTVTWNATALASIQTEAEDALVAKGLDHLVSASVTGTDITDNSIIAKMVSKSATADWDSFVNTTDSLEATRDKLTDIETDTTEIGAAGAGLTALPWNAAWDTEVQSECTDALNAYDPPTNAEMEARTPSAAQLAYIIANAATGLPVTFTTSGGSTTTAVFALVDGTTPSATNDQYKDRLLVFTDGTLKGVVTEITDYIGSSVTATITAIPTAPTSSHNARLI